MRLVEQWNELEPTLPAGWASARLVLALESGDAEEVARLVGPAGRPMQSGFELEVTRGEEPFGTSPRLFRRLLERFDQAGTRGRLSLASAELGESVGAQRLAVEWDRLVERLPPDWSHLYAEIELDSSDFVERAALLLAPANPARFAGGRTFNFRAARRVGYGVAAGMARRCLARLDEHGITGRLHILRVVSDDRPVATQGPVWREGGRAV
jgi:hypothetical protein